MSATALLYGGTGAQGRPIAKRLLDKGFRVRAVSRQRAKASELEALGVEVFEGDLTDANSLKAANRGIDALLLLLPVGFDRARGVTMGRNAIDAAIDGGASLIVYNSSGPIPASETGSATADIKLEVARYLQVSRTNWIILQPTIYLDNFVQAWAAPAIMRGVLAYPIPASFKVAWLSWEDNAAFSAAALSRPDLAQQSFLIGGPEELSGPELAAKLARHLGRDVRFETTPLEQFEASINGLLGPPCGTQLAVWYRWVAAQERSPYVGNSKEAARALGVAAAGVDEWMGRTMSNVVYGLYDQAQLNLQYSPRAPIGEEIFLSYLHRYAASSETARKTLPAKLNVAYGPSGDETLDLFTAGQNAPLVVFLHGGYWRMLSKNEFSFPALPLVPQGIAFASVNYSLAPGVSLREITRQCRAAVAFLFRHAAELGIDANRIVLAGHSAGGHLGGMLLVGDWTKAFGVPNDVVKGALLVSGLYDLEPIRLSVPQEWLNLSAADVDQLSPIRLPPVGSAPIIVSYGGSESAEFKRQTDDFTAYWRRLGRRATSVSGASFNHFDIALELARPESSLTEALVRLIREN